MFLHNIGNTWFHKIVQDLPDNLWNISSKISQREWIQIIFHCALTVWLKNTHRSSSKRQHVKNLGPTSRHYTLHNPESSKQLQRGTGTKQKETVNSNFVPVQWIISDALSAVLKCEYSVMPVWMGENFGELTVVKLSQGRRCLFKPDPNEGGFTRLLIHTYSVSRFGWYNYSWI